LIAKANFYIFLFVWSALGGLLIQNFIFPVVAENIGKIWVISQDEKANKEKESEENAETNFNKAKEVEFKLITQGFHKFTFALLNNLNFYTIHVTFCMPTHSGSCYLEIHSPPPELG